MPSLYVIMQKGVMVIKKHLFLTMSGLIITLATDYIWLGFVAKNFYLEAFKAANLLSPLAKHFDIKLVSALGAWIIIATGNYFFCVYPTITTYGSLNEIALKGFLYGFFVYATYNLTNHATIATWPIKLVLVDTLWGSFLNAFVATAIYALNFYFLAKK